MDKLEKQLENARGEYLSQSYPGDLAEIANQVDARSDSHSNLAAESSWKIATKLLIGLAALIVVALSLTFANWPNTDSTSNTSPIAKSDHPHSTIRNAEPNKLKSIKKRSRTAKLFALSRPVSFRKNHSAKSRSRFFMPTTRQSSFRNKGQSLKLFRFDPIPTNKET